MTTSLLLKSNRKFWLKVLFVFMTVILLLLASPAESHAAEIQVVLDGTPVSFNDSTGYPFLDENDRTLVPMRAVMEACGCTVDWDGVNQVATVTKGNTEVKAVAGQSCIYKNNQKVDNDSAAVVMNGRTYLPIRVVLESFGYTVKWDSLQNAVYVSSYSKAEKPKLPYEDQDKDTLFELYDHQGIETIIGKNDVPEKLSEFEGIRCNIYSVYSLNKDNFKVWSSMSESQKEEYVIKYLQMHHVDETQVSWYAFWMKDLDDGLEVVMEVIIKDGSYHVAVIR